MWNRYASTPFLSYPLSFSGLLYKEFRGEFMWLRPKFYHISDLSYLGLIVYIEQRVPLNVSAEDGTAWLIHIHIRLTGTRGEADTTMERWRGWRWLGDPCRGRGHRCPRWRWRERWWGEEPSFCWNLSDTYDGHDSHGIHSWYWWAQTDDWQCNRNDCTLLNIKIESEVAAPAATCKVPKSVVDDDDFRSAWETTQHCTGAGCKHNTQHQRPSCHISWLCEIIADFRSSKPDGTL